MLPQVPKRMYFGREVGVGNRRVISQYALPKRVYLGPTSMDTEMAFVMCNQAKVQPFSPAMHTKELGEDSSLQALMPN